MLGNNFNKESHESMKCAIKNGKPCCWDYPCECNEKSAVEKFKQNVKNDIDTIKNRNSYNPYEIYNPKIDLFRAMLNPEISKHVRFYAPFAVPTYVFQQKTSFSISLNANGCAWLQINMGQFLDASKFRTGIPGSLNGTSTVPNSNVFTDVRAALDGKYKNLI